MCFLYVLLVFFVYSNKFPVVRKWLKTVHSGIKTKAFLLTSRLCLKQLSIFGLVPKRRKTALTKPKHLTKKNKSAEKKSFWWKYWIRSWLDFSPWTINKKFLLMLLFFNVGSVSQALTTLFKLYLFVNQDLREEKKPKVKDWDLTGSVSLIIAHVLSI